MILMLILPTRQVVTKSIMINAKPADVYEYLSKLNNFNKWAIWNDAENDSTIRHNITGTDGTLGATSTWLGEEAGEGKIQITSLEINQEIEHAITFIRPDKRNAKSEFDLEPMAGNRTKVTWTFEIATPRPGNIFNLFSNLEVRMGDAFEEGLTNLKNVLEASNTAGATQKQTYEVQQLNFSGSEYAVYRQDDVKWNEIAIFFEQYRPRVADEAGKAGGNPQTASGLFYSWDDLNQKTDVAAAYTVNEGTKMANDSFTVVSIPASKAIYVDHYGDPSKTEAAYKQIDEYVKQNELKKKSPVIEQYLVGPESGDMAKWKTRIILLVE